MNTLASGIEAAKEYARRGWRVVILHCSNDGVCSCRKAGDCPSPGKHPRLTAWHEKATSDEAEIEQLFSNWPDSNLGVRLGPTSGIVDVEYDDAEGEAMAKRLLDGIATPTFQSHRSTHRLFRFPEGLTIAKAVVTAQGLEMRFGIEKRGSQTVFPPSVHASGIRYEWLAGLSPDEIALAAFPTSLVELLSQAQTKVTDSFEVAMGSGENDLRTHPGVNEGGRNDTLCRLVGVYLKTNGPDAELRELALAWGARCTPAFPGDDVLRIVANLVGKEQSKGVTPSSQAKLSPKLTLASRPYRDIEAQEVEWLWQDRIAIGKLSLLVGQPGLGKTFLACDMAARVSTGAAFPDGSLAPYGEAAILTAEDGAGDTLRPRLDAAGADVSRVHHIDGIRSGDGKAHFLSLASHLPVVERWLYAHPDVLLLVIDPISAFMGDGDSHKNAEVRAVLGPLAELAERHRIAVLGITHLSKGQAKAINRIIGSVAFVAAARAAWLIGEDPDAPERRLFLPVKNNLGKATGLAYRLVGDNQATRIEWDTEPVLITADDLDDDRERTPLEEAKAWLIAQLADTPVPSASVLKKAKADGIAERTLKRAKADLKIVSEREGKVWVWRLPGMRSLETASDAFIVE